MIVPTSLRPNARVLGAPGELTGVSGPLTPLALQRGIRSHDLEEAGAGVAIAGPLFGGVDHRSPGTAAPVRVRRYACLPGGTSIASSPAPALPTVLATVTLVAAAAI